MKDDLIGIVTVQQPGVFGPGEPDVSFPVQPDAGVGGNFYFSWAGCDDLEGRMVSPLRFILENKAGIFLLLQVGGKTIRYVYPGTGYY